MVPRFSAEHLRLSDPEPSSLSRSCPGSPASPVPPAASSLCPHCSHRLEGLSLLCLPAPTQLPLETQCRGPSSRKPPSPSPEVLCPQLYFWILISRGPWDRLMLPGTPSSHVVGIVSTCSAAWV